MTKNQWIVEWRERRIRERILWNQQPKVSTSSLNSVLIELYSYTYLPKQQVIINLTDRYANKLSREYLRNYEQLLKKWKPEAKDRASEMFRNLVYRKNPFLELIPKDSQPGKYIPIPIKYDPD